MVYINYMKSVAHIGTSKKSETPVLSEEDELFLHHITSHDELPPPLSARPQVRGLPVASEIRGSDAQVALLDGAQNIPLPETPDQIMSEPEGMEDPNTGPSQGSETKAARKHWSWLRRDSRRKMRQGLLDGITITDSI